LLLTPFRFYRQFLMFVVYFVVTVVHSLALIGPVPESESLVRNVTISRTYRNFASANFSEGN